MIRAGLDFGTTNSSMCLYDTKTHEYDFFQFPSSDRNFFPTVVSYKQRKGQPASIEIGEAAKMRLSSSNYDSYHSFKLQLNEDAGERAGRERSPMEVTADFLRKLFEEVKYNKGRPIEYIVQTVPDVWQNEADYRNAVDCLTEIYTGVGMEADSQFSFESEPVAAAVYYCQEHCNGEYKGYIIVIDYGGGTLDLTLCKVLEDGTIQPLRRCGSGGTSGGFAGRAFDVALTKRIVQKYQEEYGLEPSQYEPGSKKFEKLCSNLEAAKIIKSKDTTDSLIKYYKGGMYTDDRTVVFDAAIDDDYEVEVDVADIAETFAQVNEKVLRQEVEKMIKMCEGLGIAVDSQDNMRVLLVGGFSNMYCVESVVREMFHSEDDIVDERFDVRVGRQERYIAIAHGAALIASDKVRIDHVSKYEIGIYAYDQEQGEQVAYPIIERDKPVKLYREPQFYRNGDVNAIFRVGPAGRKSHLKFYFDDGTGKKPVKTAQTLAQLCPNIEEPENVFEIGFSIDNRNVPILHIQDKNGAVRSESLKELLESISLQIVKR